METNYVRCTVTADNTTVLVIALYLKLQFILKLKDYILCESLLLCRFTAGAALVRNHFTFSVVLSGNENTPSSFLNKEYADQCQGESLMILFVHDNFANHS